MPLNKTLLAQQEKGVVSTIESSRSRQLLQDSQRHLGHSNTPLGRKDQLHVRRDSATSSRDGFLNLFGHSRQEDRVVESIRPQIRSTFKSQSNRPETLQDASRLADGRVSPSTNASDDQANVNPTSVFDHTESLTFDDSSVNGDGNTTTVFRGPTANSSLLEIPSIVDREAAQRKALPAAEEFDFGLGPNWRAEVAAEKQYLRVSSDRWHNVAVADPDHVTGAAGQATNFIQRAGQETPSRSQNTQLRVSKPSPSKPKIVTFEHPQNLVNRTVTADTTGQPAIGEQPSQQASEGPVLPTKERKRPMATETFREQKEDFSSPGLRLNQLEHLVRARNRAADQSAFDSSRTSDYPTSSDDEMPIYNSKNVAQQVIDEQKSGRKRYRDEDIDHDESDLKKMNYEQLVQEEFIHDPRALLHKPVLDAQTNSAPLEHRLASLNKICEEDQKAMFRAQTNDDWFRTGSWFVTKFQEELKHLMEIRLERRKISMRYEDEIRRRQKMVEIHTTAVEDELQNLKRGGDQLIEGRRAGSRTSTPMR